MNITSQIWDARPAGEPGRGANKKVSEMSDIKGKVVAITGASSGIGEVTATTYAISQPGNADVSEISIRPTAQPN
jgi:hypothetical protein